MAGIPAGITTALVHLDAPVSFIGDDGRIHATIKPSIPLVWAATGTPIGNFIDNISLDPGIPLEVQLPHTDQPGFLDGNGNSITGWYYTIEVTYDKDGQNVPFPARDFQILTGQNAVDLALIPTGEASPAPQTAPTVPVTSLEGFTGAVTLIQLELDLVDNTPDAQKPVSAAQAQALSQKLGIKEAPLTPYQFGPVDPVNGSDNTAALTAMFNAANAAGIYNPAVYLPPGIWIAKGATFASFALTNGLTVEGAGRSRTRFALSTGATVPMFSWNTNVSGVKFSNMYIESITSIFGPQANGGMFGSSFENLFMAATLDTSRIYYQANAMSFIHNTFSHCEMQRTATSTVIPFQITDSGGAANFNLFQNVRMNGMNNPNTPFMLVETTMPATYLTDWTFINTLGEQNPAGLIHSKGAYNWTMVNVTDEDSTIPYNADIIRFDTAGTLAPRDITVMNSGRRGQSMAAGKFEIFVHSSGQGVTVINCNPTPVSGTAKLSLPRYATVTGTRGYPQPLQGVGSPEGVVNAVPGSTYARTDGTEATSLYLKESGTGLTGWVPLGQVLLSPGGTKFRVTVGDDGALTTTSL